MRHLPLISLALGAAMLVGCEQTLVTEGPAPAVRVNSNRAPQARVNLNQVVIVDRSLQHWTGKQQFRYAKIAVEQSGCRRTSTGTLQVLAVLRNRTQHPLTIEGRTQFFDRDAFPSEPFSAWQRVVVPANGVATYRELSTGRQAPGYYYVELREAR